MSDLEEEPPDQKTAAVPADSRERRHRGWLWIVVLAIALAAGYRLFPAVTQGQARSASTGNASQTRSVPVVAVAARTGDMGVYLSGLGVASALNTVTVRSRVDGQLISVAFREGQLVQKGDLLAELDPRPFQVQLTQAEGQSAKDEATRKDAQIDLDRYQSLFKQGLIPKQQVDSQVAVLNNAQGALESDRGQIESARLNLVYTRIEAPITGRVGLRLVDPGNIVHAADQTGLVVITQIQPIAVVFSIPEDNLPQVLDHIRRGDHLEVVAYDRDVKNKLATGALLSVDNQIDQTTGTVKLKAEFPNKDSRLFPNQFVNARLLIDTLRHAVIVPSAAIQRSPQSTFVYAVNPADDTVSPRDVTVRLSAGDETAVLNGITSGDLVVTDGVDKLQPGTRVALQKPPAATNASQVAVP